MYAAGDIYRRSEDREIHWRPSELIKYHSDREMGIKTMISKYDSKTYKSAIVPVSAFSFECNTYLPQNLRQFDTDYLQRLSSKVIGKCSSNICLI